MSRLLIIALVFAAACSGESQETPLAEEDGPGDRAQRTTCYRIDTVAVTDFEIFAFEASRPNATQREMGGGAALPACSEEGLMPWADLTRDEAAAACAESGFTLCSLRQWLLACEGPDRQPFPYGRTEKPGLCNDPKGGANATLAVGTKTECVSPYGVYDMVGNVWEWISDRDNDGDSTYIGEGWRVTAIAPTGEKVCNTPRETGREEYHIDTLGFRCCRPL